MGWFDHPIFLLGSGQPPQLNANPKDQFRVAGATPMAPGGSSATP